MKISRTDRLSVWVFATRDDAWKPWCSVERDYGLAEGGLLGVCVGVMWGPRWRGNR